MIQQPSPPSTVEVGEPSIVVALYGDRISDESIANNSHIKLILMSGNNVSISDLICTSLPIMNITIDQAVVSDMGLDETYDILTDAASSIYVYDNRSDFDGRSRSITSDAKIHRRGQTNSVFPSKSYRITLLEDKNNLDGNKNNENILGLRNDDDWILYSPYKDYEKIRNVFSMNLWYESFAKDNEWSVTNATEYRYIELFINNHYHGLYAICYPVDKKQVSLQDGETLFKKLDWTHSERDTSLTIQENGDAILPGYEIKSGDISSYNDLLSLYVNMTYSTDGNVVRLSSDMENAIDLWLYYKVSLAVDNVAAGGAKNMFVSTKNSESGIEGKKLLISPWDMDQSWRWVAEGSSGLYSYPNVDMPVEWGAVNCLLSLGDDSIIDEIKARYSQLRASTWSDENIAFMLQSYENDIYNSGAFVRTRERWPEGLYNDSSTGLSEFTEYVLKRFAYMDSYIDAL